MKEFIANIIQVSTELAPWLFLGLFVSALIHCFIPDSFFKRHLGGHGFIAVLKSVIFGVPMPLCSCSVIPVALSLKKQGAGNPASLSFLISTPQTGLDSVFVSASMLGWPFAVFKLLSALFLGLVGGLVSIMSSKSEPLTESLETVLNEDKFQRKGFKEFYDYAVNDLLYMIWRWLLVGILISAAITTWLPSGTLATFQGENLILILLLTLMTSVPLYVCATSSVPVAAALVHAGLPTSAALVFLIAGPATNVATVGAVYKTLGLRQLVIYLAVIILGSLGLAYAFDFVVTSTDQHMHHEHMNVFSQICGVALMLLFINFFIRDSKKTPKEPVSLNSSMVLKIDGMKCKGCVNKISRVFADEKIYLLEVSLENKTIKISFEKGGFDGVEKILNKIGFDSIERLG